MSHGSNDAGEYWIHSLDGSQVPPPPRCTRVVCSVEMENLIREARRNISGSEVKNLSRLWGVSASTLYRLQVGRLHGSWVFPMRNERGEIVGIRRCFADGAKCCVRGSHLGLFVPDGIDSVNAIVICEGESDTAAVLSLGFDAIGRPGCRACRRMCVEYARGKHVAVIADSGSPGTLGAELLCCSLYIPTRSVRLIRPADGFKDIRQEINAGLTREHLLHRIKDARVWMRTSPVRRRSAALHSGSAVEVARCVSSGRM